MRFCKDCKWIAPDEDSEEDELRFAECAHAEAILSKVDLISGKEKVERRYCSIMRAVYGKCGEEAKLFEAKS